MADIYCAFLVIQTEPDITGTTARDASTTLTGSFASMKAAAQNVLGQMALGEDLQPSREALVETARTYLVDNLLPLGVNAVGGIPEAIAALAPAILQTGTELLQNLTPPGAVEHQGMARTLALCRRLLGGTGAVRVHGGGFAGTVQAFVPVEELAQFKEQMEAILGAARCHVLSIRPEGGAVL